jgi:hypothetical protein
VLTFEREIEELRQTGALSADVAAGLLRRERREVFSIYPEVRAIGWLGAVLVASGVGILLAQNLDRIGPVIVSLTLAIAALGCYAAVWWRRRSKQATFVDESVLLLGGLLLSAAVGYFERNYGILGDQWQRHFLVLAAAHGIAAYFFGSRALLTLSLSSLAAYLGLERVQWVIGTPNTELSVRAFVCAALVLLWMLVDGLLRPDPPLPRAGEGGAKGRVRADSFESVFQHFAANLALLGALGLTFNEWTRTAGVLLTCAFAAFVIWWGFRRDAESFVLYGYVYAVVAVDVAVCSWLQGNVSIFLYLVLSTIAAIAGLFFLHGRFRKEDL